MTARTAAFALLMGNFVIGLSIIGPAGMIDPLASDFGISVASAAVLITFGAIVLCIGSPLVAWGVSTFDRRNCWPPPWRRWRSAMSRRRWRQAFRYS
jgi:DHA1 family inner membrane transport protein